ncbi:class I SAM-dependent methyltransferase [Mycobacterium sp. UM_WGJ]|uniref:class I SAM-dependent methyltransferase n=1 Tax=Mycobacterium sp. UM_WGJ TaxID=1370120 RepID=UPI000463FAB7|nr:class I SAM-dependent methyltransferase [Mycobacterium sp. UM_WGJ]
MPVIDARHLEGISETALLTLYQRAAEAKRPDGVIDDPMAIELFNSLDYDYADFGRIHQATAMRALVFDQATREYLAVHPRATVVALAEGLQTSFWRVDNGQLNWLSVDLEPIIALRELLLPASDRLRSCARSALDYSWMDQVDDSAGVLITAEGLLQYLDREAVFALLAACAERFPGGRMIFDSVPRLLSSYSRSRRGIKLSDNYTAPPMPFWFTAKDYCELRAVPGVHAVSELGVPPGRGRVVGRALALAYRSKLLSRFRAPTNLVEFG